MLMVTGVISLTEVKAFLGIDYDDDDLMLLNDIIPSMEEYVISRIDSSLLALPFYKQSPTYRLIVKKLCVDAYELRGASTSFQRFKPVYDIEKSLRTLKKGCAKWKLENIDNL